MVASITGPGPSYPFCSLKQDRSPTSSIAAVPFFEGSNKEMRISVPLFPLKLVGIGTAHVQTRSGPTRLIGINAGHKSLSQSCPAPQERFQRQ